MGVEDEGCWTVFPFFGVVVVGSSPLPSLCHAQKTGWDGRGELQGLNSFLNSVIRRIRRGLGEEITSPRPLPPSSGCWFGTTTTPPSFFSRGGRPRKKKKREGIPKR